MQRLQSLGHEVWATGMDLHMGPAFDLPARMVVVRLPSGKLWCHSPIPIDEGLRLELAELGPMGALVAPNSYHHLFLEQAVERYPEASVHVAPGLSRKLAKRHPELTDTAPPEWGAVLQPILIGGAPKMGEVAFMHHPSKTLLVTDLVFNVESPKGWLTGLAMRAFGTYGRAAHSRIWSWILVADKAAMRRSVKALLACDFERLVPAHGAPLEASARGLLEGMLARYPAD